MSFCACGAGALTFRKRGAPVSVPAEPLPSLRENTERKSKTLHNSAQIFSSSSWCWNLSNTIFLKSAKAFRNHPRLPDFLTRSPPQLQQLLLLCAFQGLLKWGNLFIYFSPPSPPACIKVRTLLGELATSICSFFFSGAKEPSAVWLKKARIQAEIASLLLLCHTVKLNQKAMKVIQKEDFAG